MPNWCCVNIVAKGERKQLERLADDLNNMQNIGQNYFGRLWLGNLVEKCLNTDKNSISETMIRKIKDERLRGIISPNFYSIATFSRPDTEEEVMESNGGVQEMFEVDGDCLRFSMISAWAEPCGLRRLINEVYGVDLYWSSTDEFVNFANTYNPDKIPELPYVNFDGSPYSRLEVDDLKCALKDNIKELRMRIPDDADAEYFVSDEFLDMYSKLPEEVTSPDLECEEDKPLFEVYKEVDLSYWQ